MTEIPKSIDSVPEQSSVRWAIEQTRAGVYQVLVGAGTLLVTTIGGTVRVVGGAVGGAMEGAARGVQDVLSDIRKPGPETAVAPA